MDCESTIGGAPAAADKSRDIYIRAAFLTDRRDVRPSGQPELGFRASEASLADRSKRPLPPKRAGAEVFAGSGSIRPHNKAIYAPGSSETRACLVARVALQTARRRSLEL